MMLTFCEYDTLTSSKKIVDDMWYCKKFMENGMKRFYFGIKNCETNTCGGLHKVYGNTYLMKSMHIFQILFAPKINLHFSSIFHKLFEVLL